MPEVILDYDEEFDPLPTDELIRAMEATSIITRGRSLAALARRSQADPSLIPLLISWISEDHNRNWKARIIGKFTVSHIGFGVLLRYGSSEVQDLLKKLYVSWNEDERYDIGTFLEFNNFHEEKAKLS